MNGRGGERRLCGGTGPSLAAPATHASPCPSSPHRHMETETRRGHSGSGATQAWLQGGLSLRLTAPLGPGAQLGLDGPPPAWAPGTRDQLLTLVTVLSLVAGRTLLPTLATDGVTGRARRTGTRLPAPRPEKAGLAGCRRRGERGLQGEPARGTPPPAPCTYHAGTARPGSPPCRNSGRPACRTPACSAAHTGTPPSSRARRPTAGRLRHGAVRPEPAHAALPAPACVYHAVPSTRHRAGAARPSHGVPGDRATVPTLETRYKVSVKGRCWPWVAPPPS